MNKYNLKELNAAIKEAISRGVKDEGMYDCLMFILVNPKLGKIWSNSLTTTNL